jgi:hypothetical protein
MVVRERSSYKAIHDVLTGLLEQSLHATRVNSLCDATLGMLHSGSLAVCTIGQGLAAARSLKPKHSIKQVDRLLSNPTTTCDASTGSRLPRLPTGLTRDRCGPRSGRKPRLSPFNRSPAKRYIRSLAFMPNVL